MIFLKAGNKIKKGLLAAGLAVLASSCNGHLIYDYEGNCEDSVEIYLKYDYNTARADMRAYHVGYARVYALDESGKVAAVQTVQGAELRDKNYSMVFRGLQPGHYTFHAYALQKPYESCVAGPGARFRADFPLVGDELSKLSINLDRKPSKVVEAPSCGLDTLWVGRSIAKTPLEMPTEDKQFGKVHRDTISLVRDTKYIHLTLHQIEEGKRAEIHDNDFTVSIVDDNGIIAWDNSVLEDDPIEYTPFAAWTTALSSKGVAYSSDEDAAKTPADDPIVERAAHYNISTSRLMYYVAASGRENARLVIVRNEDQETVVDINLPYYLAFGRDAYELMRYSQQEYLDREYDYNMDFFLSNGKWVDLFVKINVLSWSKRFQNNVL